MQLRNVSTSTLRCNREAIARFARFVAPTLLLAVGKEDALAWACHLLPLAPRSRYAEISRVHNFYRWAFNEGHITDIPTRHIPRPKVPRPVPRPITEDRLAAALTAAPPDIHCWLTLAAFAGLRCCEIAGLVRDCVLDTAEPPVLVVTGKGAKDRVIAMHPAVQLALRAYGLPSRGWIFRRRDGLPGPPSPDRVSWLTNRFLHELSIPDTMHSLRHRAVTQVYRAAKGDIRVAQTFAGHASPTTTAGYAAYCNEALTSAVLGIPVTSGTLTASRA